MRLWYRTSSGETLMQPAASAANAATLYAFLHAPYATRTAAGTAAESPARPAARPPACPPAESPAAPPAESPCPPG